MQDLISRQAAIDALKGLPTWWADEGGYYGGAQPPTVALLDPEVAVSAIENLPSAQPEQRWIPVTERLPDKNGKYLCSIQSNFKRKKIMRISTTDFESGINRWSPDCMAFKDRVIAWMPLPEPYHADEEGNA